MVIVVPFVLDTTLVELLIPFFSTLAYNIIYYYSAATIFLNKFMPKDDFDTEDLNSKILVELNGRVTYLRPVEYSKDYFIMIEVLYVDKKYNSTVVTLKSDSYNYYVIGNVINKKFIFWLLKQYYSDKIDCQSEDEIEAFKLIYPDFDERIVKKFTIQEKQAPEA